MDQSYAQFPQLPLRNRRRRLAHQVGPLRGLREWNHFTDGILAGEDHHQTVEAERNPSVRWCAILQGFKQKAEPPFGFVFAESERRKNLRLYVAAMNTDRAGAQFDAIQHQVVGFRAAMGGVAFELVEVVVMDRRERMVSRYPSVILVVPLKHRKIDDPKK